MYEKERETACGIVAEACGLTRRVQDEIVRAGDALTKDDRSPVTIADLAVQLVVSRRLADAFPDDPLLAEEDSRAVAADPGSASRVLELASSHLGSLSRQEMLAALDRSDYGGGGRYWVLDPIDGTKGFLRGDQYAVALALVDGGRVVAGVLGCPNLDLGLPGAAGPGCLVSASRGAGARARALAGSADAPARVDDVTDPAGAVLCESVEAAHSAHSVQGAVAARLGITAPPCRIDSQCKYAVVAAGRASVYLRLPRDPGYREKSWDHAAGSIVVEEAGGRVSDLDGRPLDFTRGRLLGTSRGIVCTNGKIHTALLEACRAELGLSTLER
jgi:3'(2'), 5'-bisphosphate nucleotidase